jgi:hypothetical protein
METLALFFVKGSFATEVMGLPRGSQDSLQAKKNPDKRQKG